MRPVVPILMYHSLDDSGSVISTSPEAFRRQISILRERGFHGISLNRLLDGWDGAAALPHQPVVITFDDAFASVAQHAVPALREAGFGATIFAVAGYLGRKNDWPSQPAGIPVMPLMTGGELRSLSQAGFEIGAHGMNHHPLDRTSVQQTEHEVLDAKKNLEDVTGSLIDTFAYPYGAASAQARRLVAEHYRAGCSTALGESTPQHDRSWLPRIEMYYFRTPQRLSWLGTFAGRAYISARGALRAARQAFASSPPVPESALT